MAAASATVTRWKPQWVGLAAYGGKMPTAPLKAALGVHPGRPPGAYRNQEQ